MNCSIFSFAEELEHVGQDGSECKCSYGFLHRFCKCYGILSKKICGESLDCPDYTQFKEEVLTPLMEEYELQNIYNADETSLFYKSLPNHTMSFDSEEVHGSKLHHSKDHMSLLLCTNMNGSEKLNPVLIGKAARPTALKKHGVAFKDLGIEYFWNQKGWMTGPVFDLWLTDWNNNLIKQNYHILLLIDNAPGHVTGKYSQHQNPVPATQYYT